MSAPPANRLYNLMPAIYRERDAPLGYPLQALLAIIESQSDAVVDSIRGLYEDLFIETCSDWVIPYIGDLVSNNLLFDGSRTTGGATAVKLNPDLIGRKLDPPVAARIRADVAKTIHYRRRKGTVPMLEELARDVTGWPCHAVEFFQLLGWNQHLEHFRPQSRWTDIRSVEAMDRVASAFDETSHNVDLRPIGQQEGWYAIPNLGFFLWRLRAYPLERVPARQSAVRPWGWHFSPIGQAAPLFSRWRREGNDAGLATELHVLAPIRRAFFSLDLERYRRTLPPRMDFTDLYGLFEPAPPSPLVPNPEASLFVFRNGQPVSPAVDPTLPPGIFKAQVVCRRLDPWPAAQPSGAIIAIDVASGRLAVGKDWPDATRTIDVSFHYGFSADLGGGPYERPKWLIQPGLATRRLWVQEAGPFPPGTPAADSFRSVALALQDWAAPAAGGAPRPNAIITVLDSRTYQLPATVALRNEGWLAIEAADQVRPLLRTPTPATAFEVQVLPPAVAASKDRNAALTLSGVVVEGWIHVTGDAGRLRLLHSTVIPGRALSEDGGHVTNNPAIVVESADAGGQSINQQLQVELAYSITGPVRIPRTSPELWVLDSIVDGLGGAAITGTAPGEAGPPTWMERSTVLGTITLRRMEISECIVTGAATAVETQDGCIRLSYVPVDGSRTPRRYRCQPDLLISAAIDAALKRNPTLSAAQKATLSIEVEAQVVPSFSDLRYGQPAYCQLRLTCPRGIRTGAEDGAEMGAFCHLKQPQRESNLRIRLQEYLPFGLEAGVIYAS
jgi:hypothetical protein